MKIPFTVTSANLPEEPVSLAEVKEFMRVTHSEEDTLIDALISAVRATVERYTRRSLIQREFVAFSEDPFRCAFLPFSPVTAITELKYNYVDSNNAIQERILTLNDDFFINTPSVPLKIELSDDAWYDMAGSYPYRGANDVIITFTAGYANAAAVPEDIKQAIKLLISHWYTKRQAFSEKDMKHIPIGFKYILDSYKVFL